MAWQTASTVNQQERWTTSRIRSSVWNRRSRLAARKQRQNPLWQSFAHFLLSPAAWKAWRCPCIKRCDHAFCTPGSPSHGTVDSFDFRFGETPPEARHGYQGWRIPSSRKRLIDRASRQGRWFAKNRSDGASSRQYLALPADRRPVGAGEDGFHSLIRKIKGRPSIGFVTSQRRTRME